MGPTIWATFWQKSGPQLEGPVCTQRIHDDFVWFMLVEEDKSSNTSIEYWFKVIDRLNCKESLSSQIKPCLSRSQSPIWMDTSTSLECQEIAQALGGNVTAAVLGKAS